MTKGRNDIRMQQLLELAQAQLKFVAKTDETINPDLRDMRLVVEAINEYDAKLYSKSNSSASQEIPGYDEYDVEEEEEVKSISKMEERRRRRSRVLAPDTTRLKEKN